jgi:outer membrane protein
LTKLQVGTAAADAFFSVLAADETVAAAGAGVQRARVLFDVVNARAQAGLRPGAEAARAQAEIAAAQSAAARAQQAAAVARAELARWVGIPADRLVVEVGPFLRLPPEAPSAGAVERHPGLLAQGARFEAARASEAAAARAYVPRLVLDATAFARSAGADGSGALGGIHAFDLSARNWAVGVNVTFPLFDGPVLRQRRAIEVARETEAGARLDQVRQDLSADLAKAQAAVAAARRVAALTPAQVTSAREAEQQASARYAGGLGTIADVADTQRLLTDAEISNALAVLSVWRAELGIAAATGDLSSIVPAASAQGGR